MPRYFFHAADGSRDRDTEGTELPSLPAARRAAIRYAGDLISDDPEMVWEGSDLRIEVTDARDKLLFTVIILAVDVPTVSKAT